MKSTLVLLLMVAATPAAAQHAGLSFAISPYAWFPSLTSSVSTARGTIETETSASDLISELDAVFMGLVEARNGRWGLLADVFYTDISQSQRTPLGRLYSRARVESTLTVASGYAAYRVYETDQAAFDVLGGVRYIDATVDLRLEPGLARGRHFSLDESWFDPVVGARLRFDFTDRWFASGFVDYGGFKGSRDTSWQVVGLLGYRFNDRWSAEGGWRYFDIEKRIDGHDVEMELNGPVIGVTFRF